MGAQRQRLQDAVQDGLGRDGLGRDGRKQRRMSGRGGVEREEGQHLGVSQAAYQLLDGLGVGQPLERLWAVLREGVVQVEPAGRGGAADGRAANPPTMLNCSDYKGSPDD